MKPNKDDDYGDKVTCAVCTDCYWRKSLLKKGFRICVHGGPYTGYVNVK